MVGKTGFEPATPWSQTKCSTKLSHFPIYGALEGIRTPDLLVRSQTLYPAELRAHATEFSIINGGSEWNRTIDTGIFSPLLYRLSYRANNKWRSRRESNSRSSAWQADVITATPRDHLVAEAGFEPTTFGLWARRATRLLHPAILN